MTNTTESADTLKERVRCMKLIDALAETWRAGLKRSRNWPGDYNDGAWNQQTGCLEELETLRAEIESASIAQAERRDDEVGGGQ